MTSLTATRSVNILLVEDNQGDVRLTKEALTNTKVPSRITVAVDGVEAMAILHQQDRYADVPRPDLILLDLNLPRKDGREVLAEVKADPVLKRIPIVILTTSQAEQDVYKAYDLHANCFITKPVDFERFLAVAKAIEHFWLSIVRLPLQPETHSGGE